MTQNDASPSAGSDASAPSLSAAGEWLQEAWANAFSDEVLAELTRAEEEGAHRKNYRETYRIHVDLLARGVPVAPSKKERPLVERSLARALLMEALAELGAAELGQGSLIDALRSGMQKVRLALRLAPDDPVVVQEAGHLEELGVRRAVEALPVETLQQMLGWPLVKETPPQKPTAARQDPTPNAPAPIVPSEPGSAPRSAPSFRNRRSLIVTAMLALLVGVAVSSWPSAAEKSGGQSADSARSEPEKAEPRAPAIEPRETVAQTSESYDEMLLALESTEQSQRLAAARRLQREDVDPALLEALASELADRFSQSSDVVLRREIYVILQTHGPALRSRLLELTRHPNPMTREHAASALGEIGRDEQVIQRLRALANSDAQAPVRAAARRALGED